MPADSCRLSESGHSAWGVLLIPKRLPPLLEAYRDAPRLLRWFPGISGRLPGFGCWGVEGSGVAFRCVKR